MFEIPPVKVKDVIENELMVEKYENHELHAAVKPTEEQASPFLTSILMFNHPDRSLYSYNCTRRTTKASSIASK